MSPEDEARAPGRTQLSDGSVPVRQLKTDTALYVQFDHGVCVVADTMLTSEQALANAVRLLENAEKETDRTLMEAITRLAETWTAVAALLHELE